MHFVYAISPAQSKAARTYLDWFQDDLAKAADVSRSTVSNFEKGFCPNRKAVVQIRKALERAGIDFTEDDGVKRRNNECRFIRGPDSCDQFFDELLQTVKEQSGEVYCFIESQDMLLQSCGIRNRDNLARLERLHSITRIKCLYSEAPSSPLFLPFLQERTLSGPHTGASSYYVFGNKYAHVVTDGPMDFIYTVFHMVRSAQNHRAHFNSLWDRALPCPVPQNLRGRNTQVPL